MNIATAIEGIDQAILAEFDVPADLQQLLEKRAIGLLPVAGRAVAQHWLDRLHDAGIRRLLVISARFPEQLRSLIRDGERWGFEQVEYMSTASLTNWDEVRSLTQGYDHKRTVFVSLNAMPLAPLVELVGSQHCWVSEGPGVRAHESLVPLSTMKAYWQVNLSALAQQGGAATQPNSHIHSATRLLDNVYVGSEVVVDRGVTLQNTVISSRVDIGEDTVIRRSVILPNTRVGSQLSLDGWIVDGSLAYSVANDMSIRLDDPMLLEAIRPAEEKVSVLDRGLAALLMLLTLPLMLGNRLSQQLVLGESIERGSKTVRVSRLVTDNSLRQRLPWLLLVLRGELPLFGVRESAAVDAEVISVTTLPGVISLADFAAPDAMFVANYYQVNVQTRWQNLGLALRWVSAVFIGRQAINE